MLSQEVKGVFLHRGEVFRRKKRCVLHKRVCRVREKSRISPCVAFYTVDKTHEVCIRAAVLRCTEVKSRQAELGDFKRVCRRIKGLSK